MKLPIFLFLLFPVGLFAQNWMPVVPGETYHYRLANAGHITHSIRVDSSKTVGADVVHYLNRVLKYEGPVGDQIAFYKQGQFLGKTMTQKPDGSLVFASDNIFFDTSIVVFPGAYLGQTWLAVAESGVMASVISVDEDPALGVQDSIKTILFSNGAEWILSKNYGLLGASDFNQTNQWVFLSGLENQGIGDRLYRFEDFFDYEVGDVIESLSYYSGQFGWAYSRFKTTVLEKTVLPEGFQYLVEIKSKTVTGGMVSDTTLSISTENKQYLKQDYKYVDAYNHQIIPAPFFDHHFSFATHFEGGIYLGNTYSSSDNPEFCSILGVPEDPNNPLSYFDDALDCTLGDEANVYYYYEEYRPKIGRVNYGYSILDNSFNEVITGAVIQGDTIWGSITPDWSFTETAEPVAYSKLVVSPNPSSGFASVQIPEGVESALIHVYSTDGMSVQTVDYQSSESLYLDLSSLPNGMYWVILRSDDRVWHERLVKTAK